MLLFAKLLDLKIDQTGEVSEQDVNVLKKLEKEKLPNKGETGGNVWHMLMGDDMLKDEGALI